MALILGGGAFGELRGKMGGMVFARNRGGAYVRQFAKPVDPKTIAQLTARGKFGSSSSNYHGLSDSVKTMWNNFASSVFNPKTGTRGVPSGFNAFVSLLNTINNAKPFTSFVLTGTAPLVVTEIPFGISDIPPSFALESNFKVTTLGPGFIPFSLGEVSNISYTPGSVSSAFSGSFAIDTSGFIGSGTTSNVISDAKDNKFGFKVFMSNPVAQASMFIQNPYLIDLGTIPALALTTPANLSEGLTIDYVATLASANYQSLPMENQFVQISIFQISSTGMLLKIGSQIVKLT
jgi:hypothetical protein